MGFFKPSKYSIENALKDDRYDGHIFVGDNYVTKDHGSHIEINIDADNRKGHDSYDLRFDDEGRLKSWEKHKE